MKGGDPIYEHIPSNDHDAFSSDFAQVILDVLNHKLNEVQIRFPFHIVIATAEKPESGCKS